MGSSHLSKPQTLKQTADVFVSLRCFTRINNNPYEKKGEKEKGQACIANCTSKYNADHSENSVAVKMYSLIEFGV